MKLYKAYVGSLPMDVIPATPAEIAEAHVRCRTCKQYGWVTEGDDPTPIAHVCDWDVLTIEDPALDYCRHHSELNKETT